MNSDAFNVRRLRLIIFILVTVLHIVLILFVTIRGARVREREEPAAASMIRLFALEEEAPPPPPPVLLPIPALSQDPIAEHIIESDEAPPEVFHSAPPALPAPEVLEFLPMHLVTVLPVLPESEILRNIVYPAIARSSNIEGTVFLELFIDPEGYIRDVRILRENPPNRGFGEAALLAFRGVRGIPAEADGIPVAVRFRYNLSFRLN